jgi:hypothetical protein
MALNDIQLIQEIAGTDFAYRVLSGIASGKVLAINGSSLPEFRNLEIADINTLATALSGKITSTEKGVANGVASLDSSGKVPTAQLPEASGGGLEYLGTWNATTNTPTIAVASSTNKGKYYKVSVAGSTNIDGITDWKIGDWVISNGTAWDKIDNTDQVSSVAGRQGDVTLSASDVGLANVINALQFLASNVDTDTALTANLDTKVASQKAVKAYIAAYAAALNHNHDSSYEPKNANIQTHISATDVHVTSGDKTNWNAKLSWASVPASATSTGTAGNIAYEDDYLYVCVASNKWKRIPMATW